MDRTQEYILCAAIKRITPREKCTYHNNDIHLIELGYRHCDIYQRFGDQVSNNPDDQGFYTSKGRFVDRKEAMTIAVYAGQVDGSKYTSWVESEHKIKINKLYSEDLY